MNSSTSLRFVGTEATSIELTGRLEASVVGALQSRLPGALRVEPIASMLVLEMRNLAIRGVPVGLSYREVLHRIAITFDGAPAWLALRCDLDRLLVRRLADRVIRYPVARAKIDLEWTGDEVRAASIGEDDARISLHLRAGEAVDATPPRRTFVARDGSLLEIPWDERAAPWRRKAEVLDADLRGCFDVFGGTFTVDRIATVHRGRTHFCGPAR